MTDMVNHPPHYATDPSGIECIEFTELMSFCQGNAFKYIFRADKKNGLEDLHKAIWYVNKMSDSSDASDYLDTRVTVLWNKYIPHHGASNRTEALYSIIIGDIVGALDAIRKMIKETKEK